MKELMVTLLVLSCTGMVWAQQNDNNGFRASSGTSGESAFGSSARESAIQTVPIVNDSNGARQRQGGPGQDGARRSGLGQGGPRQGGLGQGGGLRVDRNDGNARARNSFATPQANERSSGSSETTRMLDSNRSVRDSFQPGSTDRAASSSSNTGGVSGSSDKTLYLGLPDQAMNVLMNNGRVVAPVKNPYVDKIKISDQNTPKTGPTRTIRPQLVGDSLVFTFTKDDVDFTHRGSLVFEVPAEMKHRYSSATIEIPEVLSRISQTSSRQRTDSLPRTNSIPRTNSGFQSEDSRWKLASETNVREPIQRNDPWAANQTTAADRERQARLDYETRLRQQEAREKATLAEQNRQLRVQNDRLLYEEQQRQAAVRIQQQQPIVYPADRYAQNTGFGSQIQPIVTRPVVPSTTVNSVNYKMLEDLAEMKAHVAQLDNEHRRLNSDFQNVKAERDNLLRGRFDFNNDSRTDLTQDRNRTNGIDNRFAGTPPLQNRPAMSMGKFEDQDRDGFKSGAGGKGGIVTGQKNNSKANGSWVMMFLLLLISCGLNLYLWALSRGLYMRYQELADELRETFTVTA